MLDQLMFPLTLIAALGTGLVAGVFFAFSTFIMRALGRLPANDGIAAMQAINLTVINPIFLGVFLGTALLCGMLLVATLFQWNKPGAAFLLAGIVLYVFGSFLVTMICNVPLNNALAAVTSADAQGADLWAQYLQRWTLWNHVRTLASLASSAAFMLALIR